MHTAQARSKLGGSEGGARLGGARADFVGSLGRKVSDLRGSIARVRDDAGDVTRRDELRRKLHALGSAAKMMKFEAMDRAIGESLGRIDRAPRENRLEDIDIDAIEQVIEDLPALAWGEGGARSSRAEEAQKAAPTWSVLVVGPALIAEALLEPVDAGASFRCESTPDAQAAFDLAKASEPDLIVLDADVDYACELVEALMDDPLTETIPAVVVGSFLEPVSAARFVAMGVAKTLAKPTSRESLRAICEEAVGARRVSGIVRATLGEPTLEQLGDRLALELREALVGAADAAVRGTRVPLGEGAEVLGALWGAIARVREVVTTRTDGTVRFAGGPEGALAIAPPLHELDLPWSERQRARARGPAVEVKLQGRRVVVADDDPAVVWFMADLLKTAGCIVHEAFDGEQALELCYKSSPDVVISDILMPRLDGFSLCRALRRDVALRDIPVVLLSWKEDLLQRVRELGANAAGYVRKESDTRAVLARIREALRPRARVEARLREDGEVRGRLDGISVRTLLEIVCATRPEARVSVRDASFLYEIEIRFGAPQRAARSSGDGSFLRGSRVLAAVLGVSAGRFTVTTNVAPIQGDLDGNLASQFAKPIAHARAVMGLLTGKESFAVERVRMDEEALAEYLEVTPNGLRGIAERLAEGASPRSLVLQGGCEASLLEDLVCDLASRGVIVGVEGTEGKDLLAPEFVRLSRLTDLRASFAPRTATPAPVPAAGSCAVDAAAPLCESPDPGTAASLEEAIMETVSHNSPKPATELDPTLDVALPTPSASSAPARARDDDGTPPHDQLLALAEPTVVDAVVYGEGEQSVPVEPSWSSSASGAVDVCDDDRNEEDSEDEEREDERRMAGVDEETSPPPEMTPFATVSGTEEAAGLPRKRSLWPMMLVLAAVGGGAWAMMHFSATELPTHGFRSEPPAVDSQRQVLLPAEPVDVTESTTLAPDKTETVTYSSLADEAALAPGQGVLEVHALSSDVVIVDGTRRGHGRASVPLAAGAHDVRVKAEVASERGPAHEREERDCTVEVRSGHIAHVRF